MRALLFLANIFVVIQAWHLHISPNGDRLQNQKSGDNFLVVCSVLDYDGPASEVKINWYRGGTQIGFGRVMTIGKPNASQLMIIKAKKEDSSDYVCKAEIDGVNQEITAQINFIRAPEFISPLTEQHPEEGRTGEIVCRVEGEPSMEVFWQFNGNTLDDASPRGYEFKDNNQVLIIPNYDSKKDDGHYLCNAAQFSSFETLTINVSGYSRPLITVFDGPANNQGFEGQSVHFKCGAIGKPMPTYKWYRGDSEEPLVKSDIYGIEEGLLTIQSLTSTDGGEYRCEAKNDIGTDTKTATLSVYLRPKVERLTNHTKQSGEHVELVCRYSGEGTLKAKFVYGNQVFKIGGDDEEEEAEKLTNDEDDGDDEQKEEEQADEDKEDDDDDEENQKDEDEQKNDDGKDDDDDEDDKRDDDDDNDKEGNDSKNDDDNEDRDDEISKKADDDGDNNEKEKDNDEKDDHESKNEDEKKGEDEDEKNSQEKNEEEEDQGDDDDVQKEDKDEKKEHSKENDDDEQNKDADEDEKEDEKNDEKDEKDDKDDKDEKDEDNDQDEGHPIVTHRDESGEQQPAHYIDANDNSVIRRTRETQPGRISVTDDGKQITLTIKDVTMNDAGTYQCVVENEAGPITRNSVLAITHAPIIKKWTEQTVRSFEGNEIEIFCEGKAVPEPNWDWHLNGNEVEIDGVTTKVTHTFTRTSIWMRSSAGKYGRYICRASNGVGEPAEKVVTVIEVVTPPAPSELGCQEQVYPNYATCSLSSEQYTDAKIEPTEVEFAYAPEEQTSEPDFDWEKDSVKHKVPYSSRMKIPGLKPKSNYIIRARAINEAGGSELGVQGTIETTDPWAPERPESVTENCDTICRIQWTEPNNHGDDLTGYKVTVQEFKENQENGEIEYIGSRLEISIGVDGEGVDLTQLKPKTHYEVSVTAKNSIGESVPQKLTFETPDTVIPYSASGITSTHMLIIVGAALFIVCLVVDLICYSTNRCGVIACICINCCGKNPDRSKGKDLESGRPAESNRLLSDQR